MVECELSEFCCIGHSNAMLLRDPMMRMELIGSRVHDDANGDVNSQVRSCPLLLHADPLVPRERILRPDPDPCWIVCFSPL